MESITEKFNNHALEALKAAVILAANSGKKLEPIHILISIANQKGSIASQLLENIGNNAGINMEKKLAELNLSGFKISEGAQRILEKAIFIAALNRHLYIGTEHLLAGLIETSDKAILKTLEKAGINLFILKKKLSAIFETTSNFPAFYPAPIAEMREEIKFKIRQKKKNLYLANFCADLTDEAIQKDIDPVIGREAEIERIIRILSRRNKNNPILIGEAGVGKTAIVEGLAKKIFEKDIPPALLNKRIVSLDMNSLLAGTTFRGEFEARLKNIINELAANDDIIVFIDEIHNIIGAGSASGAMDAANILKPVLARGNIKFIGATTLDEYKKYIERDPALERRFQPVIVREPSIASAKKMVAGIKEHYEKFHNLKITEDAIEEAVRLSGRYIQDRLLPDKAIDLLDETASKYKLLKKNHIGEDKVKELESRLSEVMEKKENSVMDEKFDEAAKFKEEEEGILDKMLELKNGEKNSKKSGFIGKAEILKTLSEIINIPESDIKPKNLASSIKKTENILKDKIIAQNEAIDKIINVLKRNLAGVSSPNRPIGSFLFLGPSGVGKTEMAKTLAEALFNDRKSLIRVDMSEYSESFNISKLIGAPAGYVGYDQGGALTEKVRRNPYTIILFDELEKAHRSLFNILLQILEEGEITDASGRTINFKNAIIIMASNLGLEQFDKKAEIGFALEDKKEKENFGKQYKELKDEIMNEVSDALPNEFLNRIDEIVFFNNLTAENIKKIATLNLKETSERMKEKNISISFGKSLPQFLAEKSVSPKQGARLVRKNIQSHIENLLAEKIIAREIKEGDSVNISEKDGKIEITYANNQ